MIHINLNTTRRFVHVWTTSLFQNLTFNLPIGHVSTKRWRFFFCVCVCTQADFKEKRGRKTLLLPLKSNDSFALWMFYLYLSERRYAYNVFLNVCIITRSRPIHWRTLHWFQSTLHFILRYNFFDTQIITSFSWEISWYILK